MPHLVDQPAVVPGVQEEEGFSRARSKVAEEEVLAHRGDGLEPAVAVFEGVRVVGGEDVRLEEVLLGVSGGGGGDGGRDFVVGVVASAPAAPGVFGER